MMCRLLKVSVSGFYAWDDRPRSRHARRDLELTALIHTIHERSYGTYGAPRVHAELQQAYGGRRQLFLPVATFILPVSGIHHRSHHRQPDAAGGRSRFHLLASLKHPRRKLEAGRSLEHPLP